ncbi:MAG: hypothetical protein ACYDCD_14050 [Candidatus Acidiferrales bacterium]
MPSKPPNHLLTLEQGEDQLQPYLELLAECIQHGWDAWEKDYAHKQHILTARSRSAIVFDEIVSRAQSTFSGLPGVNFQRARNTFLLYLGDNIVIRFKKIGKNGKCSSIETRQQVLFKLQIQLPGMENGTMLHAGYALDDLQQRIIRKSVVCQFSNRILWAIELPVEPTGNVETIPFVPTPEAPQGKRFAAKSDERSKKKKLKERAAGKE